MDENQMCYQKQLIRLLKLRNFKLQLAAKVAFMLNKDFEIVVLQNLFQVKVIYGFSRTKTTKVKQKLNIWMRLICYTICF